MRFHGFHAFSWIYMYFQANVCHRDDAPKETFTRFQLAAFSSIFMDFRWFHEISWISCIFIDLYVFPWISWDFMGFHDFRGRRFAAFANGMMPLKKPLLDPSWLLFHRFLWISEDFIDSSNHRFWRRGWLAKLGWAGWLAISSIFVDLRGFHEISWISGVGG